MKDFIIVLLCILLIFSWIVKIHGCNEENPCPELKDSILVQNDTIIKHDTILIGRSISRRKATTQEIAKVVTGDSSTIVANDTSNHFCDSLSIVRVAVYTYRDSGIFISDTIRVLGYPLESKLHYELFKPKIYQQRFITTEPAKAEYYIISSVMGGYQSGAGISLMRVKKVAYGIGISTLDGKGYYNVSFGVKIGYR